MNVLRRHSSTSILLRWQIPGTRRRSPTIPQSRHTSWKTTVTAGPRESKRSVYALRTSSSFHMCICLLVSVAIVRDSSDRVNPRILAVPRSSAPHRRAASTAPWAWAGIGLSGAGRVTWMMTLFQIPSPNWAMKAACRWRVEVSRTRGHWKQRHHCKVHKFPKLILQLSKKILGSAALN